MSSLKITASVLAALITVSSLICSCESGKTAQSGEGTTAGVTEADTSDARANTPDSLPDDLSFDGATVNILSRATDDGSSSLMTIDFYVEQSTGDIVEDSIYKRNIKIEERLDVELNVIPKPCTWNSVNSFDEAIKKSVLADDDAYDMVGGYGYTMCNLILGDIYMNLYNLEYFDFTKPWWPDGYLDEMVMNGKLHILGGDISLTNVAGIYCMVYNKKLAADWDQPNYYELIFNGSWTFDEYEKAMRAVYSDVNGNSEYDSADIYSGTGTMYDQALFAFETPATIKNSDGVPELNVYNDKVVEVFNRLWSICWDNNACFSPYDAWQYTLGVGDIPKFKDGQVLFVNESINSSSNYRNLDFDYGILVFPKYDEKQENYHSLVGDWVTLVAIPTTCNEPNMVSAVIEAIAAENYRTVIPAYYELALGEKYLRDEESKEMCDIIHDSRWFNMGFIFTAAIGINGSLYRQIFQKNNNITSFYKQNSKLYETNLQKIIDYYWN